MRYRYLFGPVSNEFANQNLQGTKDEDEFLTFNYSQNAGVTIQPNDTWEDVCQRFPTGWQPEFIALYLPYTVIPSCFWTAPIPLVGLAVNWSLLWHYYRYRLPLCELVFTDAVGRERLARAGMQNVEAGILSGCSRTGLNHTLSEETRDIDVLLVGNFNPAVGRACTSMLGRLVQLRQKCRISAYHGPINEGYRHYLRRAKIAVNVSENGECNGHMCEIAASGALLFQEASNQGVSRLFCDKEDCILYKNDNIEDLLDRYLQDEPARQRMAAGARRKVGNYGFQDFWARMLEHIEEHWSALYERAQQRPRLGVREELSARTWQALNAPPTLDPDLELALEQSLKEHPSDASLRNALGLMIAAKGPSVQTAAAAVEQFQRAITHQPEAIITGLNLAEALRLAGQRGTAVEQAKKTLAALVKSDPQSPLPDDSGHFPRGFGTLRVEWECAAWQNAGQPQQENIAKRRLLRWRLHSLLAELTGDHIDYYEAYLARPDLPVSSSTLGCALARNGRSIEAHSYLRTAISENPLDPDAARSLFLTLGALGDEKAQKQLVLDRQMLAEIAPQIATPELWAYKARQDLTSILILCHNQLHYTRLCLESIIKYTQSPYELVIVDNASLDDTPGYLNELRQRSGPRRVEIIRNETNRGFAAGCNQAIAQAQGHYLLFLNNDTVVTEGWLERLLAHIGGPISQIGLVGPVSNGAPPPQQVKVEYDNEEDLQRFARSRAQQFSRRSLRVQRVTGFCLLVRREVIDRVGNLDERFGVGFFEDDDLCVRAREAGFELVIALDTYIHHFGNRTFQGLQLDVEKLLLSNLEIFKSKWGPEKAAGYQLIKSARETSPESAVTEKQ